MRIIGLLAVSILVTVLLLIVFLANADKPSSCHPDFQTKTIYLDSPDNPTFWTLKTASGEWGCKKKKRKVKI